MDTHVDKTQESISQSLANEGFQKENSSESTSQFVDNSPEALQMRAFQEIADNSPEAEQGAQLQAMADNSPEAKEAVQLQAMADEHGAKEQLPNQNKKNNTGLPDDLKTGIENLSGLSMDDVKVHYNSSKPAELQAHAYAEGTDIYIGPGQVEHLPHEAWHVVQQKQGRVKPTLKMEGGVGVNDDKGLEKEADVMGGKALQFSMKDREKKYNLNQEQKADTLPFHQKQVKVHNLPIQTKELDTKIQTNKLNLVGEHHLPTEELKPHKEKIANLFSISTNKVWYESEFTYGDKEILYGDDKNLKKEHLLIKLLIWQKTWDAMNLNNTTESYIEMFKSLKLLYMLWFNRLECFLTKEGVCSKMKELNENFSEKDIDLRIKNEDQKKGDESVYKALTFYILPVIDFIKNHPLKNQSDLEEKNKSLRKERSEHMYKAATESNKTGIWKIGEHHITDLSGRNKDENDEKFNLLNETTFEQAIKTAILFKELQEEVQKELQEEEEAKPCCTLI